MNHFFDPEAELLRHDHTLPHWLQNDVITFITMRQADSIPRQTILRWDQERLEFLRRQGLQCNDWREGRNLLTVQMRAKFDKHFHRLRELELDKCLGSCRLRLPQVAQIVSDSLLYFDDDRYQMGDFIIMPNHVHMLVVFRNAESLRKQCYSWMHFTARRINQLFRTSGEFWQDEPFDHLVRSEKQLEYLRSYIEQNPLKARVPVGGFLYRRSDRAY